MNISLSVIEGHFPPSCPVMYSGPESVRKGTPEPFVPKARTTLLFHFRISSGVCLNGRDVGSHAVICIPRPRSFSWREDMMSRF